MIYAGTGHRPDKLGGYDDMTYYKLVIIADKFLNHSQPSRVMSGMAQGWDQALAQASINNGIPLTAVCPCRGQERMWPDRDQKRYFELLEQADKVLYIEQEYTKFCMQKRNEYLVDNANKIIALWNGSSGGTGNCIKYAISKGMTEENGMIINLWNEFLSLAEW